VLCSDVAHSTHVSGEVVHLVYGTPARHGHISYIPQVAVPVGLVSKDFVRRLSAINRPDPVASLLQIAAEMVPDEARRAGY
jgi:hypothetical protein